MVLYFAGDLIWATRIKRAAEDLGIAARPVRTVEMLDARLGEGGVSGLIVDLEGEESAIEILARARESSPDLRVVSYGPHVREDLLARARELGARWVLSRGSFDRDLGGILRELETPNSAAGSA